jgi:hypothetical protein
LFWSNQDPHVAYVQRGLELIESDLRTGRERVLFQTPKIGFCIPPSADGKRLLFVENAYSATADRSYAWLIDTAGSAAPQRFDLKRVAHQVWFLKRPDYAFMLNYETANLRSYAEGQYLCEPAQGGAIRRLDPIHFSHAGVNPSGTCVAHHRQGMMIYDLATGKNRRVGCGESGHLSWQCDDRWLVATMGNAINVVWVDDGRLERVCVPNTQLGYSTYSTEAHLESSPDGTKIGYASSMLGDCDFYVAVQRLPDPPRQVRRTGDLLTWQPPEHAKELAGYYVYRNARPLQPKPLREARFRLPEHDGSYEVTAVEHSGLESAHGAMAAPSAPGAVTVRALDPYTVEIAWEAPADPGVAYYNVYAARGPVRAEQRYRVASPPTSRTIDWGLQAGTGYHYCVTAVDRSGQESCPSAEMAVTTPSVAAIHVSVPVNKSLGKDAFRAAFSLPRADDYVIWAELQPDGCRHDTELKVSLDGQPPRSWRPFWDFVCIGHGEPERVAFFDTLYDRGSPVPIYRLSGGDHQIALQVPAGGVTLKRLMITNDRGFVPEGITSFLAPLARRER